MTVISSVISMALRSDETPEGILRAEINAQKLDTGITTTAKLGGIQRVLADKNLESLSVTDFGTDIAAIRKAVRADSVRLPSGEYTSDGFVKVNTDVPVNLVGDGDVSNITKTTPASPAMFQIQNSKATKLKDFKVSLSGQDLSSSGSTIALIDADNAVVDGVNITGFAGVGSIVQAYTTGTTLVAEHQTIKNSKGVGTRAASSNTNGFLITNGKFARLQNLYIKGVAAYGIEYKNLTTHSLMLNSIVEDSLTAFAYGQTTSDDTGVSHSLAANLISLDNGTALAIGKGKYNLTANMLVDITSTGGFGNKEGIRINGTANYNSMCNFLFSGSITNAIRIGSSYNYASGSIFCTSGNVIYDAGAKGNAVEIQQSGNFTSILPKIRDNSGSSGSDVNSTYCHSTGEYIGSRSGRWRWQKAPTNTALNADSHWVFENKGTSYINIHTDGEGESGLLMSSAAGVRGLTYVQASDYWQISTGSSNYRFYAYALRTTEDNVSSLGTAPRRFSTVYAATGAINTSDERLKTNFTDIDAAESRVAVKIKKAIKRYQFTDAVDSKGDKARYHFGVGAQTVGQIMREEGLDPEQYAFYCYDEWEATEEIEAGNRYGIRYDELAMFLHAAS